MPKTKVGLSEVKEQLKGLARAEAVPELYVYNSLSRKKELFKPMKGKNVLMYVCGPTVNGPMHLGHARAYISFDLICRYLKMKGYKVKFVMNITDVHDDVIAKAIQENSSMIEIAKKYTEIFFRDMKALKLREADLYPRVTENIPEIIAAVKALQEKGYAYETEDGVYFAVEKFKDYGKLSGMKLEKKKEAGKRVQTDKYEKEEAIDFALWKKQKPNEPFWESPWGKGRPGWHIECSVLNRKFLGEQIDIHGGGMDLKFPHHENEIAQSESLSGKKPFVKYWMHAGFLNVNGQKMSKSLGNFIVVPDLLKEYSAEETRFFILSQQYSSRIDFTKEAMKNAKEELDRINNLIQVLLSVDSEKENKEIEKLVQEKRSEFFRALDDDFNTPNALAALFELIRALNKAVNEKNLGRKNAKDALEFLREVNDLFDAFTFESKQVELSKELLDLIQKREQARKNKNWKEADRIRDELLKSGIQLVDTEQGVKWQKIK